MVMILGYGIIAIPTGIITAEISKDKTHLIDMNTNSCSSCAASNHRGDAKFCYKCGEKL